MSKIKILVLLVFFMMVVIAAAINVNLAFQEKGLSNLSLANLEVLADNHDDNDDMLIKCILGGSVCRMPCNVCGSYWRSETLSGEAIGLKGMCTVCGTKHDDW